MLIRNCLLYCLLLTLLRLEIVLATQSCHYCRGINCQRSSYRETEQCVDELDACISVFQGGTIHAQGCLEKLEDHWRKQCEDKQNYQCDICLTEKCNNMGTSRLSCLQCVDSEHTPCGIAPEQLTPQVCEIARSGRSFCFASIRNQHVERGCALTLTEQRSCLADADCQLCDPWEVPHCNSQLLATSEVTTETPTISTSTSTSSSPTTRPTTEPASSGETDPPTTQSTSPTTTTSTTEIPSSARSSFNKNLLISLVISNLAMLFLCTQ